MKENRTDQYFIFRTRFYRINIRSLVCVSVCLFLLLPALAACSPNGTNAPSVTSDPIGAGAAESTAGAADSQPTADQSIGSTDLSETNPTEKQRGPSGLLRLWWSPRQSLNPLSDDSTTGKAAADLIFNGLFRLSADQTVQMDLLDAYAWSDEGLTLTMHLKSGLVFHDGTAVTANDVVGCLLFIIQRFTAAQVSVDPQKTETTTEPAVTPSSPADMNQAVSVTSEESVDWSVVQSVTATDEQTVICRLSRPAQPLIAMLTFPIIPAASLTAGPMSLIPGTGPYRMIEYIAGTGLMLQAVNTVNQESVRQILLKEYTNVWKAMQALESDELDMVLLDASAYKAYAPRSSLQIQNYVADQFVFISYQTAAGSLFADPASLLAFKQLCLSAHWFAARDDWPGEAADCPIQSSAAQLNGQALDLKAALQALTDQLQQTNPLALTQIQGGVRIIAPEDSMMRKLAGQMKQWLDEQGIPCSLSVMPAADYAAALQAGDYDLAFCSAKIPTPADPSWLYQAEGFPATESAILPQTGLSDYADKKILLPQYSLLWTSPGGPKAVMQDEELNQYREYLAEIAAQSPFSGIYLAFAGLACGDRIKGQSNPNGYHPYEGIEELWVWSGQSSLSS